MKLSTEQRSAILSSIVRSPDDFALPIARRVIDPIVDAFDIYQDANDSDKRDPELAFWSWFYQSDYKIIGEVKVRKGISVYNGANTMHYEFEVKVKSVVLVAWAGQTIDAMIDSAIKHDMETRPVSGDNRPVPKITDPKPGIETQELDIEYIDVSMDKGKRMVKVGAGKWAKFGINFWKDAPGLRSDPDLKKWYDELPFGRHNIKGQCVILMNGDKAERVLSVLITNGR